MPYIVDVFYALWDLETGNLVQEFSTELDALAAIRAAIVRYGRPYAETFIVLREDRYGRSRLIAKGAGLVDLALRTERNPPSSRAS
jgi:hypothetical protein